IILCVVLTYNSVQLKDRLEKEQAVAESLQERIDEQEELKTALEEKADYMQSEEYYKELAREKLGLAGENDIIFKKSE
ncbi:MAG: septum formation initiator family protein, partial [Lachnospiraceae bacterium]|nr:septum formation initiator family protein [Lachnospiraceae bacterium]